jgi:hypothetical protein
VNGVAVLRNNIEGNIVGIIVTQLSSDGFTNNAKMAGNSLLVDEKSSSRYRALIVLNCDMVGNILRAIISS